MSSRDEFDQANARAARRLEGGPHAVSARYDRRNRRIVVGLSNGLDISFPPHAAEGLELARAADLDPIEISPSGLGLHFPKIDADLYVPALLDGFLGSMVARRLGQRGGSARSAAKAAASRNNGRRGGRPRKAATT